MIEVHMQSLPQSPATSEASLKKSIWTLAGVTYGLVMLTGIFSIVLYYRSSLGNSIDKQDAQVAVGSVYVPLYPEAIAQDVNSSDYEDFTRSNFQFRSKDSPEQLAAFYRTRLKSGLYRLTSFSRNEEVAMVGATAHSGKTRVMVTIHTAGSGSLCDITTVDKREGPLKH